MSHLGRPDGRRNEKYSLRPVVPELEKLSKTNVTFVDDCVGQEVEETVRKASGGEIILLENLRFHPEEEGSSKDGDGNKVKADPDQVKEFRKGLTALGDVYISTKLEDDITRTCRLTWDSQMMPLARHIGPTARWSGSTCLRERRAFS